MYTNIELLLKQKKPRSNLVRVLSVVILLVLIIIQDHRVLLARSGGGTR